MVMEPTEGRVISGLNANELLDNVDDTSIVDKLLYVLLVFFLYVLS